MNKRKITLVAATMTATAALVAGTAGAALAAVQANGSDGPTYLFNNDAGAFVADNATIHWADDISLSTNTTDPYAPFTCSADATGYKTFWSDPGQERNPNNYRAWNYQIGFIDSSHTVAGPDTTPQFQVSGTTAPIKATGGNYSAGIACTKDNGVNLASSGVWYFTAHVATNGSGDYTFDKSTSGGGSTTPPPGSQTGQIGIEATTVAAADGTLSLVVPSGAKATLGTATLVNQLSTSTGSLPQFQVSDQRVVSKPGWDLTASTADFVNAADATKTIDAKQLGVKPKVVTNPGGVTAGSEHVAGDASAFSAFASAAAGAGTGTTDLGADLTLVAPASTPAGTYDSTMTLTLVSK